MLAIVAMVMLAIAVRRGEATEYAFSFWDVLGMVSLVTIVLGILKYVVPVVQWVLDHPGIFAAYWSAL